MKKKTNIPVRFDCEAFSPGIGLGIVFIERIPRISAAGKFIHTHHRFSHSLKTFANYDVYSPEQ